jgi:hypothetical protein
MRIPLNSFLFNQNSIQCTLFEQLPYIENTALKLAKVTKSLKSWQNYFYAKKSFRLIDVYLGWKWFDSFWCLSCVKNQTFKMFFYKMNEWLDFDLMNKICDIKNDR